MLPNKRKSELEQIAFELDLKFQPKESWGLINLLKDFRLFRRGYAKRISNMMTAKDSLLQLESRIFDYKFTVGFGKNRRVLRQTVFFIHSTNLVLPQFLMKPENFFHRIGIYLGMQDIDFEQYPDFSDNYLLQGEDEDFIRHTMNDELLQFFSVEKKWYLEGLGYMFVFYKRNELLNPREIKQFFKKGMEIYRLLDNTN